MADFILYLSNIINSLGYLGIFITTALEYACFPISSEILLPFIGYSVYLGKLSLLVAIMVSTLAAGFGCSFCYGVGRFGVGLIERLFFKKFPSVKEGINGSEIYFNKIGVQSVFFGRLMPIVRTYISFPAGMSKMKYSKFLFFSVSGALVWNIALITLGYMMGEHWEELSFIISKNKIGISLIVLMIIGLVYVNRKKCK